MNKLAMMLAVISLVLATQIAEARYLMEMGQVNLHPYVHGAWQTGRAVNHNSINQGFVSPFETPGQPQLGSWNWNQLTNGGYVDGYNLYQYAQSNPNTWRDPSGLWTSADCARRLLDCVRAADDDYKACNRDGYSDWVCIPAMAARVAGCNASYATCMAGSEEGLKCVATGCVVAGAGLLSQCDSPLPGPCDAAAAGVIGWWMCTPENEARP